jgi:hypothetical protein
VVPPTTAPPTGFNPWAETLDLQLHKRAGQTKCQCLSLTILRYSCVGSNHSFALVAKIVSATVSLFYCFNLGKKHLLYTILVIKCNINKKLNSFLRISYSHCYCDHHSSSEQECWTMPSTCRKKYQLTKELLAAGRARCWGNSTKKSCQDDGPPTTRNQKATQKKQKESWDDPQHYSNCTSVRMQVLRRKFSHLCSFRKQKSTSIGPPVL